MTELQFLNNLNELIATSATKVSYKYHQSDDTYAELSVIVTHKGKTYDETAFTDYSDNCNTLAEMMLDSDTWDGLLSGIISSIEWSQK